MPKVTLQSIADEVGVSRMTVSNAFSRPEKLSADLRARILAVAEELGYVGPDPAARALARGRTGTVGPLLTGRINGAAGQPHAMLAKCGHFSQEDHPEALSQGVIDTARKAGFLN